ncbi:MAG TPA: tripartite tricarboxylate transporter substrate binding protein [Burkholderiales bacterium]|nr:tripartite tricarboxylate transporter substrate binding protein [Burkholderiales bacterium]
MKRFFLAVIAAVFILPPAVLGQTFPSKTVRILCPFPPGGGVDITARALAHELSSLLGQSVIVENRPGAGGNVAAAEVARSAPDGHTLFVTLNALHAISPHLYAKLPFDAMKDFSFITPLVSFNNVLVVSPAAPFRSVGELIELAKRQPGKLTFASSGNGTNIHLVGELFKSRAGIDMVHVPYKGSAPALTDLMGGSVTMMFDTIPSAVSHIKGGKLRALGVTGAQRSPLFPDVPTIAESGLPGYEVVSWYGLIGPAGIPAPIVGRLNAEATKAAQSAGFRGRMEPLGFDIVTAAPEKMVEMLQADSARWAAVIKAAGVTIN